MGACLVLAPVVIAAWPAFSAAVVAAATSLGYHIAAEAAREGRGAAAKLTGVVNLEIDRSEVVTGQLGRDQRISVTREGVTITFARDSRGKASLCVTGTGQTEEALRALGEELGKSVVQQYVYQKLMSEMQTRGFVVVEEETTENRAIRLRVRQWGG